MPPPSATEAAAADPSWQNTTVTDILTSLLQENATASTALSEEERRTKRLHEFQIIKAVVLAAVTAVIMFSVCKMVFQLFVRYSGKQDDR